MNWPVDLWASLAGGGLCLAALMGQGLWRRGERPHHERVAQQGGSLFLGLGVMQAGYSLLQPVVRWAVRRGVSPATITWVSLLPAFAAGVSAAWGHWGGVAWGLLLSALLDVLDGAVARATKQTSAGGAILDSVLDRYAEFFIFAGALVFYRDVLLMQGLVLAALFGSLLITYSTAKAEALRITPPRGTMKRSDRITVLVTGAALTPLAQRWDQGVGPDGIEAWPMALAIGLIAVLANVSAVRRFAALSREADRG
jgi:CDP-diacylglycerol--glycerol-3-phosphate 3-phosphatidyltransferase